MPHRRTLQFVLCFALCAANLRIDAAPSPSWLSQLPATSQEPLNKVSKNQLVRFRKHEIHPVTPEMVAQAQKLIGKQAPPFIGDTSTGKLIDLAKLTSKKPVLLFFIESECPCSKEATPFFNRIQASYANGCQVIGVINGDTHTARSWVHAVGCSFPVLADPELLVIGQYGALNSVTTILIAKGGQVETTYPGYDQAVLDELSKKIARLTKQSWKRLPFEKAPKHLISGCPFDLPTATKKRIAIENLGQSTEE